MAKTAVRTEENERGVAMLELAMVCPLYLILIISVVDISRMLNIHLLQTEIAHETVRLLSGIPSIEPGRYEYRDSNRKYYLPSGAIYSGPPAINAHIDDGLQRVVNGVVAFLRPSLYIKTSGSGTTLVIVSNSSETAGGIDFIETTVTSRYAGFFILFDNYEIQAYAKGPYV